MISIRVSVDVNRTPHDVFGYLEDAENNPRWIPNMRSCRWVTPPPVGVGSRYEQTSEFLGRLIQTGFEVTHHEPGHRLTIESREGSSFPIRVTRMVEPRSDGGSHVIEKVEGDASGFYAIATPILRAMVARNVRRDYRTLKRVLEGADVSRSG